MARTGKELVKDVLKRAIFMKKNDILSKKRLLLPKIMANVSVVRGIGPAKQKEKKMITETSKSYRYEKIEESIINTIHGLADRYREITSEEDDNIIYQYACSKFIELIKAITFDKDLAWTFEIIISENFDYEPTDGNPFRLKTIKKS